MKSKEYVKKYDLLSGKKFNHSRFVGDLTLDFMSLLELGRKSDGTYNIKGFENTVRAIRQKWDGIHKKTLPGLPEKLWRYFYATVIIKTKNAMFPIEMEARAQRKKDWEDRRAEEEQMWDEEHNWFRDRWQDFIFNSILGTLFKDNIPKVEFALLELPETAEEELVRLTYKKLAMKHHPDKGGKQDIFVKITDAKNKCLAYLSNKK